MATACTMYLHPFRMRHKQNTHTERDRRLTISAYNLYLLLLLFPAALQNAVAFRDSFFARAVGQFYFDNVDCTGTEDRVEDCPRAAIATCEHRDEAGAICYRKQHTVAL